MEISLQQFKAIVTLINYTHTHTHTHTYIYINMCVCVTSL